MTYAYISLLLHVKIDLIFKNVYILISCMLIPNKCFF